MVFDPGKERMGEGRCKEKGLWHLQDQRQEAVEEEGKDGGQRRGEDDKSEPVHLHFSNADY